MNPLFAIRDSLRAHGVATAAQLAAELELPRGVVDNALAHWLRRGHAQHVSLAGGGACGTGCSSGCGTCGVGMQGAVFRWKERVQPVRLNQVLPRVSVEHKEGH